MAPNCTNLLLLMLYQRSMGSAYNCEASTNNWSGRSNGPQLTTGQNFSINPRNSVVRADCLMDKLRLLAGDAGT